MLLELMFAAALSQAAPEPDQPAPSDAATPTDAVERKPVPTRAITWHLSDDELKAALAAGGAEPGCIIKVPGVGAFSADKPAVTICSPFGNVALMAAWAKKNLRPYDASKVTEHVRSVFSVDASPPQKLTSSIRAITRIVLRDSKKAEIVEPLSERARAGQYGNAYGAQRTLASRYAEFSMDDVVRLLSSGDEFYVTVATDGGGDPADFKVKAKDLAVTVKR